MDGAGGSAAGACGSSARGRSAPAAAGGACERGVLGGVGARSGPAEPAAADVRVGDTPTADGGVSAVALTTCAPAASAAGASRPRAPRRSFDAPAAGRRALRVLELGDGGAPGEHEPRPSRALGLPALCAAAARFALLALRALHTRCRTALDGRTGSREGGGDAAAAAVPAGAAGLGAGAAGEAGIERARAAAPPAAPPAEETGLETSRSADLRTRTS